jgi:uncharacterized protein YdhG (YjbR/CyaY superfamily)
MATSTKSRIKATTFDEYLAKMKADQRAVLEKLRKTIRSVAPNAEEGISYGLAAFRLNGRPLVGLGAASGHCALFPMDSTTVTAFAKELKGYDTSKGTIRFDVAKPLPAPLVRRIVKARVAQVSGAATKMPAKPRAATKKASKPKPRAMSKTKSRKRKPARA